MTLGGMPQFLAMWASPQTYLSILTIWLPPRGVIQEGKQEDAMADLTLWGREEHRAGMLRGGDH